MGTAHESAPRRRFTFVNDSRPRGQWGYADLCHEASECLFRQSTGARAARDGSASEGRVTPHRPAALSAREHGSTGSESIANAGRGLHRAQPAAWRSRCNCLACALGAPAPLEDGRPACKAGATAHSTSCCTRRLRRAGVPVAPSAPPPGVDTVPRRSSGLGFAPEPRFSAPNHVRRLPARWLKTACVSRAAIVRVDTKRSNRSTTAQYKPTTLPGILTPGL